MNTTNTTNTTKGNNMMKWIALVAAAGLFVGCASHSANNGSQGATGGTTVYGGEGAGSSSDMGTSSQQDTMQQPDVDTQQLPQQDQELRKRNQQQNEQRNQTLDNQDIESNTIPDETHDSGATPDTGFRGPL